MIVAGQQDLKCSQEQQFCRFVYALEIKGKPKKDERMREEARWGIDYRIADKFMCLLKCGYAYFRGVLIQMHRKQWAAFAQGKHTFY